MREILRFYCEKCGYETTIWFGSSLNPPTLTNENKDKFFGGMFTTKTARKFFDEHPEGKIVCVLFYFAKCVECNHYQTGGNWIFHIPSENDSFEEEYYELFMRIKHFEDYAPSLRYHTTCEKCSGELKPVLQNDKLECPICQGELKWEDAGMWD